MTEKTLKRERRDRKQLPVSRHHAREFGQEGHQNDIGPREGITIPVDHKIPRTKVMGIFQEKSIALAKKWIRIFPQDGMETSGRTSGQPSSIIDWCTVWMKRKTINDRNHSCEKDRAR